MARRYAAPPAPSAAAGSGPAAVWAIVKANAYGHGIANALRAFESADALALVEFDAAVQLRECGWNRRIVMLEGAFEPADVEAAGAYGLSLAVHEETQVEWLEALRGPYRLDVHLKLDSGMGRLGFDAPGLRRAHARLAAVPAVASLGVMTHFANADVAGGTDDALHRFTEATAGLAGPRSLANSAALIDCPATHGDAVRPGIMLYGASPFADRAASALGLHAAMTLETRLIAVRQLSPGDAVGYGSIFRAPRPMRIGVAACGYADGYPRNAPNGTPVIVDGVRTGTVGRVSMDMLAVDLTPVPQARVGSPVELWGAALPIDDVAAAAGTIGYELMCALAARVPVTVVG